MSEAEGGGGESPAPTSKAETVYVILAGDDGIEWQQLGVQLAQSGQQAIRRWLGGEARWALYVAVPATSFRPRRAEVVQTTMLSLTPA